MPGWRASESTAVPSGWHSDTSTRPRRLSKTWPAPCRSAAFAGGAGRFWPDRSVNGLHPPCRPDHNRQHEHLQPGIRVEGLNMGTGNGEPAPTPAGIYDYLLGGTHHTAADREAAEKAMAAAPESRAGIIENRAFMRRAVRFAAGRGIRQYI